MGKKIKKEYLSSFPKILPILLVSNSPITWQGFRKGSARAEGSARGIPGHRRADAGNRIDRSVDKGWLRASRGLSNDMFTLVPPLVRPA